MSRSSAWHNIAQKMRTSVRFVGEIAEWAQDGFEIATNSAERMNICRGCEFYIAKEEKCQKCGCYMNAKTKLKTAKCPIEKW
jgi:Zn finger protein HypA/HybF involved in hydrogenase expression